MRPPMQRDNSANGFRRLMNIDTINISMYASFSIITRVRVSPAEIFCIYDTHRPLRERAQWR